MSRISKGKLKFLWSLYSVHRELKAELLEVAANGFTERLARNREDFKLFPDGVSPVIRSGMEKIITAKGERAARRMGKPSDTNVPVSELFVREMIIATGSMDKQQHGDEAAVVS